MSLKKFSDYLFLEKKYSEHTVLAYQRDLETFQEFLKQNHESECIDNVGYIDYKTMDCRISK